MRRLGLIDRLEICLEAVYFVLLVASWARVEGSPCNFDLAAPAERYTVGVRWRAESSPVGCFGCSVDSRPLPDPDLRTTNFAESPRWIVWLQGAVESAGVPLSPAYMSREKSDSALVWFCKDPRLADTGRPEEVPATVPMTVCWSGLGKSAGAPRVGPCAQRDDSTSRLRKKEKGDMTKAVGERFWVIEKMTDAPKAAGSLNPRL